MASKHPKQAKNFQYLKYLPSVQTKDNDGRNDKIVSSILRGKRYVCSGRTCFQINLNDSSKRKETSYCLKENACFVKLSVSSVH